MLPEVVFAARAARRFASMVRLRLRSGGRYGPEFYRRQKEASRNSARVVLPMVQELIAPRSVIDLGCGVGAWLRVWRELGVEDVLGRDGDYVDRTQLEIPQERFTPTDLNHPLPGERRFDLAMCLEVAEHLRPERSEGLVTDLTALAPVVLFSAALPGQGGNGHVNERRASEWVGLFQARGYRVYDVIRARVWADARVEWWYRQNLLILANVEEGDLRRSMEQAAGRWAFPAVDVVHPECLGANADWGGLKPPGA